MKYKCITITKDSGHEAASRIEDDEMQIVIDEKGRWYPAGEFFAVKGDIEFTVE